MKAITLTTDFGIGSPYVAAMKGVILSFFPECRLIDLTHDISPQRILQGAIVLHDVFDSFPEGTIHVAVVDPGVGTARKIVAAKMEGHYFVAPDNGLLSLIYQKAISPEIVRLTQDRYWRHPVSSTFHGRDIMAPVAAQLAKGIPLQSLGKTIEQPVRLRIPEVQIHADFITVTSLFHDSFGNVITNLRSDSLDPTWRSRMAPSRMVEWKREKKEPIPCRIVRTYGEADSGEAVGLIGSSGRLELAVVDGNAAQRFNIAPEETFRVQFVETNSST